MCQFLISNSSSFLIWPESFQFFGEKRNCSSCVCFRDSSLYLPPHICQQKSDIEKGLSLVIVICLVLSQLTLFLYTSCLLLYWRFLHQYLQCSWSILYCNAAYTVITFSCLKITSIDIEVLLHPSFPQQNKFSTLHPAACWFIYLSGV